jgi:hypothetical protein
MKTRADERHGKRHLPEYAVWRSMVARCHRATHPAYADYGARGIFVCEQWRRSFATFFANMGPRPEGRYTLDRIDNAKGYEPGNCRWATYAEQSRNNRAARMITIGGRTQCHADWAKENGIHRALASFRERKLGWTVERSLTEAPHRRERTDV